jgi:hypothetical protein
MPSFVAASDAFGGVFRAFSLAATFLSSGISLTTTFNVREAPFRQTCIETSEPGRVAGHDPRQVGRGFHRLAIELEDDVGRFHPGLVRRLALLDGADERAPRLRQSEGLRKLLRHLLDADADPTAADAAGRTKLVGDVHGDVDRDREGEPHESAGTAVDLGIDADDLTAQIEERTARVAGVDRNVGLDERYEALLWQRAPLRAHDTGRDRAFESERRPDGEHPFAHAKLLRVADRHHRQPVASILMSATSVRRSLPITLAVYSRLSFNFTVMSSPASTTCAFVRM